MSKKTTATKAHIQEVVTRAIQKDRWRGAKVAVRYWYIHLAVYVAVNLLFSIYGLLRGGLTCPIMLIVFWGTGLIVHSVSAFGQRRGVLSEIQVSGESGTQQGDNWWQSRWIRIYGTIALVAVVFGIMQPFLWMLRLEPPYPEGAMVLSNLLTILLALLALGVGVFGASVYLVLKGRIEDIARKEAKKRSDEVQAEVTHQLVLEIVKIAIEPARNSWRTANALQNQKGQEAERKRLQNWSIFSLKDALAFAKTTLPVAQNKDFWENPKKKKYLITLKNNLAFYMAYRKDNRDRENAREYASEVVKEAHSQSVPNYHYLDTAAWVFRQFALDDKDRKKSEALVLELTNREDIPDKDKKKLLDKYTEKPKDS